MSSFMGKCIIVCKSTFYRKKKRIKKRNKVIKKKHFSLTVTHFNFSHLSYKVLVFLIYILSKIISEKNINNFNMKFSLKKKKE